LVITQKSNAAKSDYQRSVVVDLTGQNTTTAQQMASLIGGDVSALPAGESKPTDATTDLFGDLGQGLHSASSSSFLNPAARPVATP